MPEPNRAYACWREVDRMQDTTASLATVETAAEAVVAALAAMPAAMMVAGADKNYGSWSALPHDTGITVMVAAGAIRVSCDTMAARERPSPHCSSR